MKPGTVVLDTVSNPIDFGFRTSRVRESEIVKAIVDSVTVHPQCDVIQSNFAF